MGRRRQSRQHTRPQSLDVEPCRAPRRLFMRLPGGSEETALRSQGRRGHGNRILVFTTLPRPMERVESERHPPDFPYSSGSALAIPSPFPNAATTPSPYAACHLLPRAPPPHLEEHSSL